MEIQPGCDPAAGTSCTGLAVQVRLFHTVDYRTRYWQTAIMCPAHVELAVAVAVAVAGVEVG